MSHSDWIQLADDQLVFFIQTTDHLWSIHGISAQSVFAPLDQFGSLVQQLMFEDQHHSCLHFTRSSFLWVRWMDERRFSTFVTFVQIELHRLNRYGMHSSNSFTRGNHLR